MIQKLFLNTQMIWKILVKILKNRIQIKSENYHLYLMTSLLICLVIKKLNPIVTELFIRGRKLNISLVFITQSHFVVGKNTRLNSRHYFVIEIPSKREVQQIAFNHSSDIDFQVFIKKVLQKHIFLVIDINLGSDNHLRFRKNLAERI